MGTSSSRASVGDGVPPFASMRGADETGEGVSGGEGKGGGRPIVATAAHSTQQTHGRERPGATQARGRSRRASSATPPYPSVSGSAGVRGRRDGGPQRAGDRPMLPMPSPYAGLVAEVGHTVAYLSPYHCACASTPAELREGRLLSTTTLSEVLAGYSAREREREQGEGVVAREGGTGGGRHVSTGSRRQPVRRESSLESQRSDSEGEGDGEGGRQAQAPATTATETPKQGKVGEDPVALSLPSPLAIAQLGRQVAVVPPGPGPTHQEGQEGEEGVSHALTPISRLRLRDRPLHWQHHLHLPHGPTSLLGPVGHVPGLRTLLDGATAGWRRSTPLYLLLSFEVRVPALGRAWRLRKTYSDFALLHRALRVELGRALPDMPRKPTWMAAGAARSSGRVAGRGGQEGTGGIWASRDPDGSLYRLSRRLQSYLEQVLDLPRALELSPTLRTFLELSSRSLDPILGWKGKEGWLLTPALGGHAAAKGVAESGHEGARDIGLQGQVYHCGPTGAPGAPGTGGINCVPSWFRYWFSVRDSYIAVYTAPEALEPVHVIMLDQSFTVHPVPAVSVLDCGVLGGVCVPGAVLGSGGRGGGRGAYSGSSLTGHTEPATFSFSTEAGALLVKAASRKEADDWLLALSEREGNAETAQWAPLSSFAPPRREMSVRWLVDGRNTFAAMLSALRAAQHEILLTGWWINPDLSLIREDEGQAALLFAEPKRGEGALGHDGLLGRMAWSRVTERMGSPRDRRRAASLSAIGDGDRAGEGMLDEGGLPGDAASALAARETEGQGKVPMPVGGGKHRLFHAWQQRQARKMSAAEERSRPPPRSPLSPRHTVDVTAAPAPTAATAAAGADGSGGDQEMVHNPAHAAGGSGYGDLRAGPLARELLSRALPYTGRGRRSTEGEGPYVEEHERQREAAAEGRQLAGQPSGEEEGVESGRRRRGSSAALLHSLVPSTASSSPSPSDTKEDEEARTRARLEASQLKSVLRERAMAGVKIRVLMYQETEAALPLNSAYQKKVLSSLHPNIAVMRHGSWFWSHHEKLVLIDRRVGFAGGLDMAWGRWDTGSHLLVDPHKQYLGLGVDYYNAAFSDYAPPGVEQVEPDRFDRSKYPRMPWHDVHTCMKGKAVLDLARHFTQRWNFTRADKGKWHLPVLLPFQSFDTPTRFLRAAAQAVAREAGLSESAGAVLAGQVGVGCSSMVQTIGTQTSFRTTGIEEKVPRVLRSTAPASSPALLSPRERGMLQAALGPSRPLPTHLPTTSYTPTGSRPTAQQGGKAASTPWNRTPVATTEWYCSTDWTQRWHTCNVQVCRSVGRWSGGIGTECSIFHAYVHAILGAKHSIYIENQYILSSLGWNEEERLQFEFAVGTGSGDVRARDALPTTAHPDGREVVEQTREERKEASQATQPAPQSASDLRWSVHQAVRQAQGQAQAQGQGRGAGPGAGHGPRGRGRGRLRDMLAAHRTGTPPTFRREASDPGTHRLGLPSLVSDSAHPSDEEEVELGRSREGSRPGASSLSPPPAAQGMRRRDKVRTRLRSSMHALHLDRVLRRAATTSELSSGRAVPEHPAPPSTTTTTSTTAAAGRAGAGHRPGQMADPRAAYAQWWAAQHQPELIYKPVPGGGSEKGKGAGGTGPAAAAAGGGGTRVCGPYPPSWGAQEKAAAARICALMGGSCASSAQRRVAEAEGVVVLGEGQGGMASPTGGAKEKWQHATVAAAQLSDYTEEQTAPPGVKPVGMTTAAAPGQPGLASPPPAPPTEKPPSQQARCAGLAPLVEASGGVLQWDPARNSVFEALFIRLCRAIERREDFCVSILLPLHPDGPIRTSRAIQLVLHWEQCTIAKGPHSLLGRLSARFPGVDLGRYVNFVALRNHAHIPRPGPGPGAATGEGGRGGGGGGSVAAPADGKASGGSWCTEIVYVHSKLLIADDRLVIVGSANINDRSMYGDRDSEIALLVSGGDRVMTRMAGRPWKATVFAHTLRRNLMEEHLGLAHTCDVFNLGTKMRGRCSAAADHGHATPRPAAAGSGRGSGPLPTFRVDNAHACGTPMRLVAPSDAHRRAARMPTAQGEEHSISKGYAAAPYHVTTSASRATGLGSTSLRPADGPSSLSLLPPYNTTASAPHGVPQQVTTANSKQIAVLPAPPVTSLYTSAVAQHSLSTSSLHGHGQGVGTGSTGTGGVQQQVAVLEQAAPLSPADKLAAASAALLLPSVPFVSRLPTGVSTREAQGEEQGDTDGVYEEVLARKDAILTAVAELEGTAGCDPVSVLQERRRRARAAGRAGSEGLDRSAAPVPQVGDACALDALLDPADPDGAYGRIWVAAAASNAKIYGTVFPGAIQDDIATLAEWREREGLPPHRPELLDGLVGKLVAWPARFLHGEDLTARPGEVEYLLPSKVTQ